MTRPRSLLVVDDVPEILSFFERRCASYRTHPVEITMTSDAQEALALVSSRPFDVVISDLRMPYVNGVQVLAAARDSNPAGRRILMTGYNEIPVSAAELDAAGLSARLQKPVCASVLARFFQACFSSDPHALDDYNELGGA